MPMTTFHNGERFRFDCNPLRGTSLLLHVASGRWVYMDRNLRLKFEGAMYDAPACDFTSDDCYEWVWTNAGFHRLAGAAPQSTARKLT